MAEVVMTEVVMTELAPYQSLGFALRDHQAGFKVTVSCQFSLPIERCCAPKGLNLGFAIGENNNFQKLDDAPQTDGT